MRTYVVQPGDSPASIASRDEMAGCPKCGVDLVRANPHKQAVVHPNGFTTFKELRAGETLNLPDKWFNGELDSRPKAYFAALPYADGRTPSTLGDAAAGILGDYATLDSASAKTAALASLSDQDFSNAVSDTASTIDQSVQEADNSVNPGIAAYAAATHLATASAIQGNQAMIAALSANNQTAVSTARAGVQNALLTGLDSARLALQAVYGSNTAPTTTPAVSPTAPTLPSVSSAIPATVVSAAQAVAAAVAADPNYCATVGQVGSAANTAVHLFKTAWNAANPTNPLPINTGNYEQAAATALSSALGTAAPPACPPRAVSTPSTLPTIAIIPPQQQPSKGLITSALFGLGLLGAGAVGVVIYLVTNKPAVLRNVRKPRVRRVSPSPSYDDPDDI